MALFASLTWGGWGVFANFDFGVRSSVIAGITQGACTFLNTYILSYLLTLLYNKLPFGSAKIIFTPLIAMTIIGSVPVGIHIAVGTPAVLYTVSPGLTAGLIFSVLTTLKLYVIETTSE